MMPIVNVKLLEGRSDEQLKNLVSEVTDAVEKTTGANRQAIHVVIEENETKPLWCGWRKKVRSIILHKMHAN